jgi:aconitate hydratase
MKKSVAYKIMEIHKVDGSLEPGSEIGLRIDTTLTQDATGTLACLQFEALELDRVRTEISVSYVDHNTLQTTSRNMDDHQYLQSLAASRGIYFSRAGNGICHQVHLERFARPGFTLLGSDSHTPTAGGIGVLAIGAGGLDVACAMAGYPFYMTVPRIVEVHLTGSIRPWVSAKDVILHLLREKSVKGGVGVIFEYTGPGVSTLTVPQRATITNMGAELGATTSIFPSDSRTLDFMKRQARDKDFIEISADEGAHYDERVTISLDEVVPLAAAPHSPDNIVEIAEIEDTRVDQVAIGSCTNSSYQDLWLAGKILENKTIARNCSLIIAPGSRQVLSQISRDGTLTRLLDAGARLLESACGPCIGMGQAPSSEGVSLRTFNRNFKGRSGTDDASIYLVSPETAAFAALYGRIVNPMDEGDMPEFTPPDEYIIDDRMIIPPAVKADGITIKRGPGIKPLPELNEMPDSLRSSVILKTGDNISTDDILPAGAAVLPFRSDIPKISEFTFSRIDPSFHKRAKKAGSGVIIGGENYGQGSSREHAALAPRYLGIRVVLVKSFARIHRANLVNFGILPLTFAEPSDYDLCDKNASVVIENCRKQVAENETITVTINGKSVKAELHCSESDRKMLLAGGKLSYVKSFITENK